MFFTTFEFLINAIGLAGGLAQLVYLKKLAMRIPDPALSERANTLIWGFSISYGAMLVFFYIPVVIMTLRGKLTPASLGSSMMFFGCIGGVAGLAAVVFGFMYLFMLTRFGVHLMNRPPSRDSFGPRRSRAMDHRQRCRRERFRREHAEIDRLARNSPLMFESPG